MCVAGRCLVRKDGAHARTVSSFIMTTTHQRVEEDSSHLPGRASRARRWTARGLPSGASGLL